MGSRPRSRSTPSKPAPRSAGPGPSEVVADTRSPSRPVDEKDRPGGGGDISAEVAGLRSAMRPVLQDKRRD